MSDTKTVYVQVAISWTQTRQAMQAWLNSAHVLPIDISDKQLVVLMAECENARKRLQEKEIAHEPNN